MPRQPGLFDDDPHEEPAPQTATTGEADAALRRSLAAYHEAARDVATSLPETVHFGTSSWSFPGWAGLVYGSRRTAAAAAREGLREYATHPLFTTVGIDRSFYAPIPIDDLRRYADQLPDGFRCCLKAPVAVTSAVLPGTKLGVNPDFLSASRLVDDLLEPCAGAFAAHTGPIVVECPPIPRALRVPAAAFAERLDAFLAAAPREFTYGVELRDRALLTAEYVRTLARHGATHTFNYWSAMPLPGEQADVVDPAALTSDTVVIRLLLRPGTRYAEQRRRFHPFNRIIEPDTTMQSDTVDLIRRGVGAGKRVFVLVNNKAEGSAPLTVMTLAKRLAAAPA